ncbi:MAG: CSLREA domain-containing protein, partial [Thermoflexales bacterium]|nr:CSLREA domain-containing protein [Thermoflexales bacterium]
MLTKMLKGRVIKHLIVPAAALAAALLTVGSAQADTITVTLGWDRLDPGATSDCSLREAIQAANTNSTVAGCTHTGSDINDLIVFDGAVSAVSITRTVSADNDDNDDGDLDAFVGAVSGTLTVRGPISVQVDANLFDRAFDVFADGSAGNLLFTLERVTVSGGDVRLDVTPESYTDKFLCTFSGGALRVGSGVSALLNGSVIAANTAAIAGGGICALPDASLTLTGTTIQSNTAGLSGTTPVDYAWGGGGIWSNGALVMTNSQVLNNRAVLSGSNGHLIGGGGIAVVTGA